MECCPDAPDPLDYLNCRHASLAEDDLPAYGLEPGTSRVTLTKRTVCTQCGSKAVVAYRYAEDDQGPTLVPR
jgi:hypothetical protein